MRHAFGVMLAGTLLLAAGCKAGKPLVDTSRGNPDAAGTIGGILQAQGGGDALAGRRVEAIGLESATRYSAVTNVTGGFTIQVPPGKYRLEVELREGERVTRDPGTIDINASDLDANIVVEVGR
jgi:carboxypeptidase family protein